MELNEQTYEAIYYILSKSLRQNYELLIIKIYLKTLHQFINSLKIEQELDHLLLKIEQELDHLLGRRLLL